MMKMGPSSLPILIIAPIWFKTRQDHMPNSWTGKPSTAGLCKIRISKNSAELLDDWNPVLFICILSDFSPKRGVGRVVLMCNIRSDV